MNAVMFFCDICDKTINIKSKLKDMYSKSHKQKENFVPLLKKMNLIDQTLFG